MMHFHDYKVFVFGGRAQSRWQVWRAAQRVRAAAAWLPRTRAPLVAVSALVLAVASVALGLLTNHVVRHWLVMAVFNICVLGGIVAAPLVSLLAWIGLALPARAPLHQASSALFGAALIWLCLAIVGAHTRAGSRTPQA